MDTVTRVQILDAVFWISNSANILGKLYIKLFSFMLWVNCKAD